MVHVITCSIFTALSAALNAGRSSRKKSVRMSVCSSNAWTVLSFLRNRMVGEGDPFYVKFGPRWSQGRRSVAQTGGVQMRTPARYA